MHLCIAQLFTTSAIDNLCTNIEEPVPKEALVSTGQQPVAEQDMQEGGLTSGFPGSHWMSGGHHCSALLLPSGPRLVAALLLPARCSSLLLAEVFSRQAPSCSACGCSGICSWSPLTSSVCTLLIELPLADGDVATSKSASQSIAPLVSGEKAPPPCSRNSPYMAVAASLTSDCKKMRPAGSPCRAANVYK